MNDLKDLVDALEGSSFDRTGYAISSAVLDKAGFWNLTVSAYWKEETSSTIEESEVGMLKIIERFEGAYGTHKYKWIVLKAEAHTEGAYFLLVKKVEDEEDSKTE